jgi:hypothetical protein
MGVWVGKCVALAVGVRVGNGVDVTVGVLLAVQVGQGVSVRISVQVGKSVDVLVGVRVADRVDVAVGVLLGVQVGQWVSVGRKTWFGILVGVSICESVEVVTRVSVGAGISVTTGEMVCTAAGVMVAVRSNEAAGVEGTTGLAYFPLRTNALPAMTITIKINASPKYLRPAAIRLRRSGQLARRRLICMEWEPARILTKAPSKPKKMAMMRPVRISIGISEI